MNTRRRHFAWLLVIWLVVLQAAPAISAATCFGSNQDVAAETAEASAGHDPCCPRWPTLPNSASVDSPVVPDCVEPHSVMAQDCGEADSVMCAHCAALTAPVAALEIMPPGVADDFDPGAYASLSIAPRPRPPNA